MESRQKYVLTIPNVRFIFYLLSIKFQEGGMKCEKAKLIWPQKSLGQSKHLANRARVKLTVVKAEDLRKFWSRKDCNEKGNRFPKRS
jgi:hypothetical protein